MGREPGCSVSRQTVAYGIVGRNSSKPGSWRAKNALISRTKARATAGGCSMGFRASAKGRRPCSDCESRLAAYALRAAVETASPSVLMTFENDDVREPP